MHKLFLKKQHLNFTQGWMAEQRDLSADNPVNNLLAKLLNVDDSEEAQDTILQYMDKYEKDVEGVAH